MAKKEKSNSMQAFNIKVGPFYYVVLPLSKADKVFDEDTLGACSVRRGLIYLQDEEISPERRAETLLHEVLHACYEAAGLQQRYSKIEEEVVDQLSRIIFQVLRDNPKLVSIICQP